jgi:dihydrofolate reductase
MPIFHAIAAMSENGVIGDRGKLPWHLPEDFRWFKHKTMGGTLIMGRKTFESIGKPLPGRRTIVVTRTTPALTGVEVCADLRSLSGAPEEVWWVCGGAEIYRQLLPQCTVLYLTLVKRDVTGDAFFPEFKGAFRMDQVIHETEAFRVERWVSEDSPAGAPEAWPF